MMKRKVVTLSGSLRFWDEILDVACKLSSEGVIVLAPFKDPSEDSLSEEGKIMHDELHHQRIDMSDELYVINKDGYIGNSTCNEIIYAIEASKPVRFTERAELVDWNLIFRGIKKFDEDFMECLTPTISEYIIDLTKSVITHIDLLNLQQFNYPKATMEIYDRQSRLRWLLEAINKKMKNDPTNQWSILYDIKMGAFYKVRNDLHRDLPMLNDTSLETLMYVTSSELIEILNR